MLANGRAYVCACVSILAETAGAPPTARGKGTVPSWYDDRCLLQSRGRRVARVSQEKLKTAVLAVAAPTHPPPPGHAG
jgi:hypothetical protein